ncbi:MAG TPA: nucleotide sugar dehydrogenase [Candidatus Brocadiales bacterium]|nr:nucleotide sugar dehydrogenase [Candidatus Brocadiales bacterium]
MALQDKISNKEAKVGIIGLGYVGLPMAVEFARKGFNVAGIDTNPERVSKINKGESYVLDVKNEEIKGLVNKGKLKAFTHFNIISKLDTVSICVPTPLRKTKDPDMSYIISATEGIKRYIHKEQLIILESTTYPGTTEELILPMLEESGLKVGKDFFLAFSPERIDPGNPTYNTRNIPKVVGGVTRKCVALAKLFYEQIMDMVVPVSSTRVAEMVKLLENTFRSVNIALVNEIALMCEKLNINVWEVIDAAKTKPFGFMPFYPGPGIGGHCIPIDPFYLSWKAKMSGFEARFIELAGQVNSTMPHFVVDRITDALNNVKKSIKGSHIHVLGVAYKKNVNDARESPALDIINILRAKGSTVTYTDPYIPEINHSEVISKSKPITDGLLKKADCVVIITDHSAFDYKSIVRNSKIIVDTRNALKGFSDKHITRL